MRDSVTILFMPSIAPVAEKAQQSPKKETSWHLINITISVRIPQIASKSYFLWYHKQLVI